MITTTTVPQILRMRHRPRRAAWGLELGIFSGAMPEMQDFDGSPVLVEAVVEAENGEAAGVEDIPLSECRCKGGLEAIRCGRTSHSRIARLFRDASPSTARKFLPDRLTRLRGRGL